MSSYAFPGQCRSLDETKRISRIFQLLQLILSQPNSHTRRALAERFEVSERMIQKDLDVIRHGLKLDVSHSRNGYALEDTPRLPAIRYTLKEALAIWLAIQSAQRSPGICSEDLSAAVARLEALLPLELANLLRLTAASEPPRSWKGRRAEILSLLGLALAQQRKVQMVYRSLSQGGRQSERVVRPYRLMPYVRSWHLIAWCEARGEVRIFKVDRIERAAMTDEGYSIPDSFDMEEYMGDAWGVMRGGDAKVEEILVRFDEQAGKWVSEEFWHRTQQCEPHPEGGMLFSVKAPVTPELINWLLYYGARAEVLKPAWLRARVAEEHRRAAEVNGAEPEGRR